MLHAPLDVPLDVLHSASSEERTHTERERAESRAKDSVLATDPASIILTLNPPRARNTLKHHIHRKPTNRSRMKIGPNQSTPLE